MAFHTIARNFPIGVFDSGIGGLTVLSALNKYLPEESFIYLGDTARLPYGTKSEATIERYTRQVAELLFQQGIKLLIIACNTATACGLPGLQQSHPDLPVIGVIEPGAQKACELSETGHIAVLCTEATARGGAYEKAVLKINPQARVIQQSCGLYVSLVEEGFSTGLVAQEVTFQYLRPLLENRNNLDLDCIVLGCTHFPVLTPVIRDILPSSIQLIDSAETTAESVKQFLIKNNLTCESQSPQKIQFLCTDSPERFARIGSRILSEPISVHDVQLVDIL